MSSAMINIDLDDIDTDDLVSELKSRSLTDEDKRDLLGNELWRSLDKFNLFLKVMDRYSLLELQTMFSELTTDPVISKEQLKLSL